MDSSKEKLSLGKKIIYGFLIYLGIIAALIGILFLKAQDGSEQAVRENGLSQFSRTQEIDSGLATGELVPEWAPRLGPDNAKVTIVEFGDFQCPFCQASFEPIRRIVQDYPDQVRLVYRHFPVDFLHPLATTLAHASMCADEQGKFWAFHDRLFQFQESINEGNLINHAQAVGLEMSEFSSCQMSGRYDDQIKKDLGEIVARGGRGTPTWIVNGQLIEGYLTYNTWKQILSQFGVK